MGAMWVSCGCHGCRVSVMWVLCAMCSWVTSASRVLSISMFQLLKHVTLEKVALSPESQSHSRLRRWKLAGAFTKESSL